MGLAKQQRPTYIKFIQPHSINATKSREDARLHLKKIETALSSTRLTIWLLVLIGVAAIFGTLIPQNQGAAFYTSAYGSSAALITALEMDDLYHSFGFLLLIILFALNLGACTTKKWPAFWRLMTEKPDEVIDEKCNTAALRQQWAVKRYTESMGDEIRDRLKAHGFKPTILQARTDRLSFFAEKGKISRSGFFAVHLGILLIMAGAVLSSFGFRGSMMLLEGETSNQVMVGLDDRSETLDFQIRCDDFELTTYAGSQRPKDYKSRLTILEDGREILSRVIEVNAPLSFRGVTIYQASYGTLPDTDALFLGVQPADSSRPPERLKLKLGEKTPLGDGQYAVQINRLVPDFVMDENREVHTRSEAMRNPAVSLTLFDGDDSLGDQWLFARHANFHTSQPGPWRFVFMGVSGKDYTGLQLTRSPGLALIWAGCLLLIAGLFVIFFTVHRRIWVRIEKSGDGATITVAASSNRNAAFKPQMAELFTAINKCTGSRKKNTDNHKESRS